MAVDEGCAKKISASEISGEWPVEEFASVVIDAYAVVAAEIKILFAIYIDPNGESTMNFISNIF